MKHSAPTAMQEERPQVKDYAKWIEEVIRGFVNKSPENTLKDKEDDKTLENPLIGFSSGDDHIYQEYKENVGHFHWVPLEIFANPFPDLKRQAEDLTVISCVLPKTEAISYHFTKCGFWSSNAE